MAAWAKERPLSFFCLIASGLQLEEKIPEIA
jgi:hypothetical protein